MLAGEFERAWEISDRVLRERAGEPCWDWPRHEQHIWRGASLAEQRVLIRCYHGLGDTVQFIRYLPMVQNLAREVGVWVQPTLIPLLRSMKASATWLPLHDGKPEFEYDADIEIMELPHYFRSSAASLPNATPYLFAEPRQPLESGRTLQVGLAWTAGSWNPARSVSLEEISPLLSVPGITWHALQRGGALQEWREQWGPVSGSDRIEEAAKVMRSLDLVISVDSLPSHLAAALGVETWTLLPRPPDWRWLAEGERSPWYPSMRLFRQEKAGEWRTLVANVKAALKQRLDGEGLPENHTRRGERV